MKPSFRASSLDRIITCHGSRALDTKYPHESKDSDVSLAGTKAHAVGALRLIEAGAIGEVEDPTPGVALEGFDLWIVDYWVQTVLELVPAGWAIEVEGAFEVAFLRFVLTGHIDVLAISPDGTQAIIIDLKTGYNPVDAAECNWQLAGYAALVRCSMPGIRQMRLVIVQPRNNEAEGYPRVSETSLDLDLCDVDALIESEINAVLDDPLTFTTAKKGCLYCDFALTCPATIALKDDMKLQLTQDQFDAIPQNPSTTQLAEWVRDGKLLEKPIKLAREELKEQLTRGIPTTAEHEITLIDGTRIFVKDGQGPRKVENLTTLLLRLGVVVPEEKKVHACLTASLDDVERTVAGELGIPIASKKVGAMSGKSWVINNLGDLITREPTKQLIIA